jgi:hypothetical protein
VSTSAPWRVPGDRQVRFTAHAHDRQGRIVGYTWAFGDGRGGTGPKVEHAYQHAGSFTVKLRILDSWANWTYTSRHITVHRPPRPVVDVRAGSVSGTREFLRFFSSAAVATFQCRIDRRPWVACRSPFATPRLTPGQHKISVRARDTFGQRSRRAAVYMFTVA